jgi:hypothetical protein
MANEAAMTAPDPRDRTHRVIGAVIVAAGRALDLALIESDGGRLLRRIETERVPLRAGADRLEAIALALEAFMGDRALQPFAVDLIGLAGHEAPDLRARLADRVDVAVVVASGVDLAMRPRRNAPPFAAAERVALAALAVHLACAG